LDYFIACYGILKGREGIEGAETFFLIKNIYFGLILSYKYKEDIAAHSRSLWLTASAI
jgi:hypothetical protein